MALPSQQDLINAAANAETLEKVVSDPADQPNPGHPDGTVTTRLDKTYYNVQAALKAITDFSAALKWEFDDATAMSDPSAGNVRLNNATISSVTSIAISETDAEGEDVGDYVNSWADSTDANKGTLVLRSYSGAFAVFKITAITDDTGWVQVDVTYLSGSGSFTIGEAVFAGFSRTGDAGGVTVSGTNTLTGSNTFNGAFALNGGQSETLAATTNNLSLDATSNRLDVDLTGDQTLNGLTGGVDGRIVILRNIDASETLTLADDASGSTAANRFSLPASQSFAVLPGQSVALKYQSSRWGLIAQTFATGVSSGNLVAANQSETTTTSATTTVLGSTLKHGITGTTTITAFNGVAGVTYHCRADGSFLLTHDATDLDILQTGTNITTAADDTFDVYMRTSTTCEIRNYQLSSGQPLAPQSDRFLVQEQLADGVNAGGSTNGSWTDRGIALTEVFDVGGNVTVSSSTFTLEAGTYEISCRFCTGNSLVGVRGRFYDVTNSTDLSGSLSESAMHGNPATYNTNWFEESHFIATFASATELKLQYFVTTSVASGGLGFNDGLSAGYEIYSSVYGRKIS
jgi:hypothetical protein